MREKSKETFPFLDWFRLVAAVLVVAVHTSPLAGINGMADFVLTRIIARLAVPFFFMVTGYFLFQRGKQVTEARRIQRFCCHTGVLYLLAILLYLPLNIYNGSLRGLAAGRLAAWLLVDGTFYHLWYLPAAVAGVLLAWGLMRLGKDSLAPVLAVAGVLYLVGLGGDSYYGLAAENPAFQSFYEGLFGVIEYTRNGFFFAPIFLALGAYAHRAGEGKDPGRRASLARLQAVGFAASMALLLAEGVLLHSLGLQRHDSMYVMLVPASWFLFRLLLAVNSGQDRAARKASMLVYLLHPWVIVLVRGFAKLTRLTWLLVENDVVHFVAVCAGSLAIAGILTRASAKFYRKGQGR